MINSISILIPIFNDDATRLVSSLAHEAQRIGGLDYEIVIYDDGSTDAHSIDASNRLCQLPHCRCVHATHSRCRAAMRNAMIGEARHEWCLMVDARLTLRHSDFLQRYLSAPTGDAGAVCGGVVVDGGDDAERLYAESLRFRYEKSEERHHSLEMRQQHPYRAFRTTNIMFRRSALQRAPYDESIIGYGYEDVMLGKCLQLAGIGVMHIDNPVAYTTFESNSRYLEKLEEALRTLHAAAPRLQGFSPLLAVINQMQRCRMLWLVRCWHRLFGGMERRWLSGRKPSLLVLKLYKLGYYATL